MEMKQKTSDIEAAAGTSGLFERFKTDGKAAKSAKEENCGEGGEMQTAIKCI
jgi:hypothetical protein